MTDAERHTPPEDITDEERCGEWVACFSAEGVLERTWWKGYLTLDEARACELAETEHAQRAIKFAERIGSDRLRIRGEWASVCCNCIDTAKLFGGTPTFGGLSYTFVEEEGRSYLSASRDRSFYSINHEELTAIIDAADYALWGYVNEYVSVHKEHAQTACDYLLGPHEENHKAATALAEIQRGLLQLWRPEGLSS